MTDGAEYSMSASHIDLFLYINTVPTPIFKVQAVLARKISIGQLISF